MKNTKYRLHLLRNDSILYIVMVFVFHEGWALIFGSRQEELRRVLDVDSQMLFAPRPVDCKEIQPIDPVIVGQMQSLDDPYYISFSWWDVRLKRPGFKRGQPLQRNPVVTQTQKLLKNVPLEKAFIDVGANVGFMTMFAVHQERPVIAIDPIAYDIAKLCEGFRANRNNTASSSDNFFLYHAAAGETDKPSIDITRPAAGHFDQAALSRQNLQQADVVTEQVPLVRVDSIVPADLPIGVVKIDVQGHEYGVLSGMKDILGRREGYPTYIYFEDDERLQKGAGYIPGACVEFLKGFGYECEIVNKDTLCTKH